MQNLFNDLPTDLSEELVEVLAENKHIRIERIVSTGHADPEGFWYDQEEHEWVVVLKGEAKLLFKDDDESIHMKPGDHIYNLITQKTPSRMDHARRTDRLVGRLLQRRMSGNSTSHAGICC